MISFHGKVLAALFIFTTFGSAQTENKVENLTRYERETLIEAQRKVEDAEANLEQTQEDILRNHGIDDSIDSEGCYNSIGWADKKFSVSKVCSEDKTVPVNENGISTTMPGDYTADFRGTWEGKLASEFGGKCVVVSGDEYVQCTTNLSKSPEGLQREVGHQKISTDFLGTPK